MKKLVLTSLLAAFAVSSANAATNYFVGGAASLRNDNEHDAHVAMVPEIGWKYNDKWDFGAALFVGYDHNYGHYHKYYDYAAGLFARYDVMSFGDFHIKLKGMIGAEYEVGKFDGHKDTYTSLFAEVYPMVTYDVTEAFTLYANLKFLGAEANYMFKHNGNPSEWDFGMNFNSGNVLNTEDFQIGFTYNF